MRIHMNAPNYFYYNIPTLTLQYEHSTYKIFTQNNPDLLEIVV
jgi:hypothetical protein